MNDVSDDVRARLALAEAIKTADADELRRALHTAVSIIENYQLDIRSSGEWLGIDLVSKGFCQGSVYRGAYDLIRSELRPREPEARSAHK